MGCVSGSLKHSDSDDEYEQKMAQYKRQHEIDQYGYSLDQFSQPKNQIIKAQPIQQQQQTTKQQDRGAIGNEEAKAGGNNKVANSPYYASLSKLVNGGDVKDFSLTWTKFCVNGADLSKMKECIEYFQEQYTPYKQLLKSYDIPITFTTSKPDIFTNQSDGPLLQKLTYLSQQDVGVKIFALIEAAQYMYPKFQSDMKAIFGQFACRDFKSGMKCKVDESIQGLAKYKSSFNRICCKFMESFPRGQEELKKVQSFGDLSFAIESTLKSTHIFGKSPFRVYDLLRCGAKFSTLKDFNNALKTFAQTYRITRIKNKMTSPLSQCLVNFEYSGDYDKKGNRANFIFEAQFVYLPDSVDSKKYTIAHRLYELQRVLETPDLVGLKDKLWYWGEFGWE